MNLLEYNMKLTEHFSLEEMLRSDLAIKYGIKNEEPGCNMHQNS